MDKEIREIRVCDMHTGGEPLRIVTGDYPAVKGNTILDKLRYHRDKLDYLRKFIIFEPRGHESMYGAVMVEKDDQDADLAVLFMHNEGYSTMCGHGVIALARYAVDHNLVKAQTPSTPVNIQTPCGLVKAVLEDDGKARFTSVPVFTHSTDQEIELPGYGTVRYDIGYGGAYYAILPAQRLGLKIDDSATQIRQRAMELKEAIASVTKLRHPSELLAFLYGVIVTDGEDEYSDQPTRNVIVFAEGAIDRSPCGSGVSARLAVQYHKRQIGLHQSRTFVSLTGSQFTGQVMEETSVGDHPAVIVEVSGRAFYSGTAQFQLEDEDKLGQGFLIK